MLTCYDIAKYFLSKSDDEIEERISNLKLQKLVYYAQGFHLAMYGKPLFDEKIEAWAHGPVVSDLYHKYKEYGANGIPRPKKINLKKFDKKTIELLDEVYNVYGQYSAWRLREMTHEETPWKKAHSSINKTISHKSLKEYFVTLLN